MVEYGGTQWNGGLHLSASGPGAQERSCPTWGLPDVGGLRQEGACRGLSLVHCTTGGTIYMILDILV